MGEPKKRDQVRSEDSASPGASLRKELYEKLLLRFAEDRSGLSGSGKRAQEDQETILEESIAKVEEVLQRRDAADGEAGAVDKRSKRMRGANWSRAGADNLLEGFRLDADEDLVLRGRDMSSRFSTMGTIAGIVAALFSAATFGAAAMSGIFSTERDLRSEITDLHLNNQRMEAQGKQLSSALSGFQASVSSLSSEVSQLRSSRDAMIEKQAQITEALESLRNSQDSIASYQGQISASLENVSASQERSAGVLDQLGQQLIRLENGQAEIRGELGLDVPSRMLPPRG